MPWPPAAAACQRVVVCTAVAGLLRRRVGAGRLPSGLCMLLFAWRQVAGLCLLCLEQGRDVAIHAHGALGMRMQGGQGGEGNSTRWRRCLRARFTELQMRTPACGRTRAHSSLFLLSTGVYCRLRARQERSFGVPMTAMPSISIVMLWWPHDCDIQHSQNGAPVPCDPQHVHNDAPVAPWLQISFSRRTPTGQQCGVTCYAACMGHLLRSMHGSLVTQHAWVTCYAACMAHSLRSMHGSLVTQHAWVTRYAACMGQSLRSMHGSLVTQHAWGSLVMQHAWVTCYAACMAHLLRSMHGSLVTQHAWVTCYAACMGHLLRSMHGSLVTQHAWVNRFAACMGVTCYAACMGGRGRRLCSIS